MQSLFESIYCIGGIFILMSILSLLITIIIYKIRYEDIEIEKFINLNENNFLLYCKVFYYLIKEGCDISKILTYISWKYKGKGFFHINLLFSKFVLLFNPDHIKVLLSDIENIDRSFAIEGLKGVIDDSFLIRNGEKWRVKRKLLNPVFQACVNDEFVTKIEHNCRNFVEILKRMRDQHDINVVSIMKQTAFEIFLDTFMGAVNSPTYMKLFSLLEEIFQTLSGVLIERICNIFSWREITLSLTSKGRKYKRSIILSKELMNKIISEQSVKYKDETSCKNDYALHSTTVLDILFNSSKNNSNITFESIIDDAIGLIVAGHHTTAITLSWCLHEVGKNFTIQRKIQEELNSIFKNNVQCRITKEDLNEMKYLECVIKETMRLYPIVPITSRIANKELQIGTEIFPKNYSYVISIFNLHRNPDFFPNPTTFNPDRFFPENASKIYPFSYIPFSAGPRMCIGYRFAMMNMKIFLATIFRNFYIESIGDIVPRMGGICLETDRPVHIKFINI